MGHTRYPIRNRCLTTAFWIAAWSGFSGLACQDDLMIANNFDPGSDSDPGGDADTGGDSDSDADGDTGKDADTEGDADADGDTGSDGDTDSDGNTDADGDTGGGLDTEGNTGDTDADKDTDSGGDTDADGDTDSDADSDADIDGDTDADSDTETDTDTGPSQSVAIPRTCAEAERSTTSVGCLFYAVDLQYGTREENFQFGVAISNVNQEESATVAIYRGNELTAGWDLVSEREIGPMALQVFELDDLYLESSGMRRKGSYKIVSTVPIIAYQFNPVVFGGRASSDAALLIPVSSLSLTYDVVGTPVNSTNQGYHFTVVATSDGTEITVEPSGLPAAGGPVPGEKIPFTVVLDEGDVVQVSNGRPFEEAEPLTGTRITANEGHPVVLFSAHQSLAIPYLVGAADHLEEQLPGMRFWGKQFVASRMPVRGVGAMNETDNVMWQIYAGENDTTVSLSASPGVAGLTFESTVLDRGESVELLVSGTEQDPGDFYIDSDKPIAVMQYMTGCSGPNTGGLGDPAMVYVSPTEQYLSRYVVLVPESWGHDVLVVTRTKGAQVLLDGAPVNDALFVDVADTEFQVGRIAVEDGVHTLESEDGKTGINVLVVGYDNADSYAYPGGMGVQAINPIMV